MLRAQRCARFGWRFAAGDRQPVAKPDGASWLSGGEGRRSKNQRSCSSSLREYLSDNWVPIIEKDVDGPNSLPLRIDGEVPNLGKMSATRRVARTIYLGSAPTAAAAHRGLEDRRVKLGCVMPGESPAVFGDALRRLASAATYLYQDGPRAWYATPADGDEARRGPFRAAQARSGQGCRRVLETRLRTDLRRTGDFSRIHTLPRSGADVPDDYDTRLVVLPAEQAYTKEAGNAAETAAKAPLELRGNAPRLYWNTLVFLTADKVRLQDLDEALRTRRGAEGRPGSSWRCPQAPVASLVGPRAAPRGGASLPQGRLRRIPSGGRIGWRRLTAPCPCGVRPQVGGEARAWQRAASRSRD